MSCAEWSEGGAGAARGVDRGSSGGATAGSSKGLPCSSSESCPRDGGGPQNGPVGVLVAARASSLSSLLCCGKSGSWAMKLPGRGRAAGDIRALWLRGTDPCNELFSFLAVSFPQQLILKQVTRQVFLSDFGTIVVLLGILESTCHV